MHGYAGGLLSKFGFIHGSFNVRTLVADVVREGTFEGQHTIIVQQGLRIGMLLLYLKYVFLQAFFHSSFNPSISIGGVWPGFITILDPWKILFEHRLLLSSGASVTWAHNSIVWGSKFEASVALLTTIILVIFTGLQVRIHNCTTFQMVFMGLLFIWLLVFMGFVIVGTIF
jgi:heme/copper-type cytochrome/quinol oxidase subunit 3